MPQPRDHRSSIAAFARSLCRRLAGNDMVVCVYVCTYDVRVSEPTRKGGLTGLAYGCDTFCVVFPLIFLSFVTAQKGRTFTPKS